MTVSVQDNECHPANNSPALFDIPPELEKQSELMHASALVIGNVGILLRGQTGSGKSVLQRYLRNQARILGSFSALISDDYVRLARVSGSHSDAPLLAFAPLVTSNRQEVRGLGIRSVTEDEYGPNANAVSSPAIDPHAHILNKGVMQCLVDLVPTENVDRMQSQKDSFVDCLGAPIRHLVVPQCAALVASDIIFAYLSTQRN